MSVTPSTVETIVPFLIDITRSDTMPDEKRKRAAAKVIERIRPFYPDGGKKLDAIDTCKLINRLKAWVATSNILGLNPDTTMVVSAYFPNPLEQYIEFEDVVLDEVTAERLESAH